MDILQSICERITETFWQAFGSSDTSTGKNYTLPASNQWIPVINISKKSILRILVYDAQNDAEYTFNDSDTIGARALHGVIEIQQPIKGTLFMRSVDSTKTCDVNVYIIGLTK